MQSQASLTVEQTDQLVQWKLRLSGCAAIQSKMPALYIVVRSDGLHEDAL